MYTGRRRRPGRGRRPGHDLVCHRRGHVISIDIVHTDNNGNSNAANNSNEYY